MHEPATKDCSRSDTCGSRFDKDFNLRRLEITRMVKAMGGACHTGMMAGSKGETIEIYLGTLAGQIIGASFYTNGNHFSSLCAYTASKLVIGLMANEAAGIDGDSILALLGNVPEEEVHFAYLAAGALQSAIRRWNYSERGQSAAREVTNERQSAMRQA